MLFCHKLPIVSILQSCRLWSSACKVDSGTSSCKALHTETRFTYSVAALPRQVRCIRRFFYKLLLYTKHIVSHCILTAFSLRSHCILTHIQHVPYLHPFSTCYLLGFPGPSTWHTWQHTAPDCAPRDNPQLQHQPSCPCLHDNRGSTLLLTAPLEIIHNYNTNHHVPVYMLFVHRFR